MSDARRCNLAPIMQSARCGAKTRAGAPCQAPATQGKARCRMHGGVNGSGVPKGNKNAVKSWLHGAAVIGWRNDIIGLMSKTRAVIAKI